MHARGALPAGKRLQQLAIRLVNIFAPENEDRVVNFVVVCEEFSHCFYGNLRGFLDRVAVRAATDRRKRYRPDSVFHRDLQRVAITICQRLRLSMFSAAPDRSDGVDHKAGGQMISTSDFRFARWTTAQGATFGEQFRAGSAVNFPIDSSSAEERRVRRVHNCVNLELGDIAAQDFNLAPHTNFCRLRVACAAQIWSGGVLSKKKINTPLLQHSISPAAHGASRSISQLPLACRV